MTQLNPTLTDGLWSWRAQVNDAAMVISTLEPAAAACAAQDLARELAQPDRAVVLMGVGARAPLFWHVPAGKELDTVKPEVVLLLVQNKFSPSARLLLAMSHCVILITGDEPEEAAEASRLMGTIVQQSAASHVEVVVVSDSQSAAQEIGSRLAGLASAQLGNRTSWRRLSARKIRAAAHEEGSMTSAKVRPFPLSEAESRAREWEENFRKAERLLQEAQEALRLQMERSAAPVRQAQLGKGPEDRAQAV